MWPCQRKDKFHTFAKLLGCKTMQGVTISYVNVSGSNELPELACLSISFFKNKMIY